MHAEEKVMAMVPCPRCGRTFLGQDRVDVHMRGCTAAQVAALPRPSTSAGRSPPRASSSGGGPAERPKLLLCYICGKEFGSKSLAIHEPQCAAKFEAQQALLPESQRRSLPRLQAPEAGGSLEDRNAAAQQAYEAQVMVPFPGNRRTFSGQDRLDMQMPGCQAGGASIPRVLFFPTTCLL